jgi:hypothetical protein
VRKPEIGRPGLKESEASAGVQFDRLLRLIANREWLAEAARIVTDVRLSPHPAPIVRPNLDPIACGIIEPDQLGDVTLIGKCARPARDLDAVVIYPAGQAGKLHAARHFPAHHRKTGIAAAIDDQPLLAVVHAKGADAPASIGQLHPKQIGGHLVPLIQLRGFDPDVAERGDFHPFLQVIASVAARDRADPNLVPTVNCYFSSRFAFASTISADRPRTREEI